MLKGKCQCGDVQFEARGEITELSHCHCSMCRELHGAAFVTFAGVDRASFAWLSVEDLLRTYASSEHTDRLFCGNCGSQLGCIVQSDPNSVYLAMGTIVDNPATPPAFHQFVASKAPWFEITDTLPCYDDVVPEE